jgi:DNA invertase Pin-like site-specific DNA recombinase
MTGVNATSPTYSSPKIRPRHLDRLAVVYVRQSSPHQVAENRESADLQYQLRRRAVEFGWPERRVLVIDDDQGISGQSIEGRVGFQRLLAEISLDHVGMVFGREVSRLSRSNKDWHQLLELCAIFHVLIGDADGVYDPMDPNDRLLLGLRGMMSEAELHVLKSRLHQGKLNKARRGELFTCVPIGFVRTGSGGIAFDPDEQVRSVIDLIFAKFAELGSAPKVRKYLTAHGIRIGVRIYKGPDRGQLIWHEARRRNIYAMLRHPAYAGAYVYGRASCDKTRIKPGRSTPGRRLAPREEWILLRDRIPAYISWEQFEANQQRLRDNSFCRELPRTKDGRAPTLLNRIITCGHCGRPMAVRNTGALVHRRYACDAAHMEFGGPLCQSVSAAAVDRLIEELILRAVEPAALELSLQAAQRIEEDRERVHQHRQQSLARAEYESSRAKRQYDAVDPDNRLVARELERQWEQKLIEQQQLEEEYARFQHEQPRQLAAADRQHIRALAADVPALWHAPTTTAAEQRAVVRQLIERVTMARRGLTEAIDLTVRWRGGAETYHTVQQGLRCYSQLNDLGALKERLLQLRGEGQTGDEIAEALNREGFRPARGKWFNGHRVRQLLTRLGQANVPAGIQSPTDWPQDQEWWLRDIANELGVKMIIVHRWRWSGWIHTRRLPGRQGRCIVWADAAELRRLRRLRAFETSHHGQTPPEELTTPKPRPSRKQDKTTV